ncbi:MAG: hypothetical protein LR015_09700 [Verrucomicrobia bacterium]|nr:hypothetical protein [Verrucomicrobiota bacterium]
MELRSHDGTYYLLRGGEPFWIKGAGGSDHLATLASIGGNSIRTWGEDPGIILDKAHALGLTVCVGLWIEHERHGFDYDDNEAWQIQLSRHKAMIDAYKDHPALLMWGIGNEVEINYTNHRVWDFIQEVAAYARAVDPNHPVMTVTAHLDPEVVAQIKKRAPAIQILGVNAYGGLGAIAELAAKYWKGPYVIAEWGPNGQWEVDKTTWGAELEPTSTHNAFLRALRHNVISGDRSRSLGGYAFKWGYKQEVTPTWYGVFTRSGAATESVEILAYAWQGRYPDQRAPRIHSLTLNSMSPQSNIVLQAGEHATAAFKMFDISGPVARVHWEVMVESPERLLGGDYESRPDTVPTMFSNSGATSIDFVAPIQPGPYRLYLYVYGPNDRTVATGNIPFLVLNELEPPDSQ